MTRGGGESSRRAPHEHGQRRAEKDTDVSSATDRQTSGTVFNIQKYSVHDGPGIRTIIFLKGCSLRCQWCSNPESQLGHPQLAYNQAKCITVDECKRCLDICPKGAISVGEDRKPVLDMALCDDCLKCAEACPTHALNVYGYEVTVDQALRRVEEDDIFYSRSGGGLTLSGGEPLFQSDFALALLREARRRRIDTCVETCGNVPWPTLQEAANYLNNVYFDLKSADPARHQEVTGASNERIIENLHSLAKEFPDLPITVRTPVIPGINDGEDDIAAIIDLLPDSPKVRYELLAYHRMGLPKYGYLGRDYLLGDTQNLPQGRIAELRAFARQRLGERLVDSSMEKPRQDDGQGNTN